MIGCNEEEKHGWMEANTSLEGRLQLLRRAKYRDKNSRTVHLKEGKKGTQHTPLMIRVPILVTNPLTLSDRREDRARVEPGSVGASKATHSCSPLFRDARLSCSKLSSHSSSQAYYISIFDTNRGALQVMRYQGAFFLFDQLLRGNWWPDSSRHGWVGGSSSRCFRCPMRKVVRADHRMKGVGRVSPLPWCVHT